MKITDILSGLKRIALDAQGEHPKALRLAAVRAILVLIPEAGDGPMASLRTILDELCFHLAALGEDGAAAAEELRKVVQP